MTSADFSTFSHASLHGLGDAFAARSVETSADKLIGFHPIYLPHLHLRTRSVSDFVLVSKLVHPEIALYAVSVRQTGISLRTSFRFHLAMDTLVFRLQFLLTSLYRTFTDESTHMPRIHRVGGCSLLGQPTSHTTVRAVRHTAVQQFE